MNILLLTPFLPHAQARAGSPRAVADRLRLLEPDHTVTVVCFVTPDEQVVAEEFEREGLTLICVPRARDGQLSRARNWAKRARLAAGLLRPARPMLVQEFASLRLRRLLRSALIGQAFDVVLVEHILMAQYLPALAREVPVVLSDHDVRLAFPGAHERAPRNRLQDYESRRWRAYATKAYRRARTVLVPTTEDAAWLSSRLPGLVASVVPYGSAAEPAGSDGPRDEETLLFVGNFAHPPNRDAARRLVQEVLPAVHRQLPEVRVWLVGKNATPAVQALAGPSVVVTGEVPSVAPYLHSCTVFVSPLRQGGGMRMKTLEALAAGVPVVTTTIGAAGLNARAGEHLLIADTVEEMAYEIVRALTDPALRHSLSTAGRRLATGDPAGRRTAIEAALRGQTADG